MPSASLPILFAPTLPQMHKPLMVLLPGLDGTGRLFGPQVKGLAQYFDVRCLTIPETNRQDWESLALSVIRLIQEEQRSRPTYLCGESFGGCLALRIALAQPQLLDRLILVNPASSLRLQFWSSWMTKTVDYVPDWLYAVSGSIALALLANFEQICEEWQQRFVETVRAISQECVAWRLAMLQQFVVPTYQIQALAIPTALIASVRDRLLPSVREIERLRLLLPDSVTHYLPESGHICLLEENVDLVQCLARMDFLPITSTSRVL